MTDNLKESLSALIDGEASEIEIHRLLRHFQSDNSLRPSWISYLQVRAVIQGENCIPVSRHLDLHDRITAAIGAEAPWSLPTSRESWVRHYAKPIAGLAVAASLVVAVLVGVYIQSPTSTAPVAANTAMPTSQPIDVQTVSTGPMAQPDDQQLELKQLDEEQQRQLRAYLNMHDQMARMNPNARMVIFENPNAGQ